MHCGAITSSGLFLISKPSIKKSLTFCEKNEKEKKKLYKKYFRGLGFELIRFFIFDLFLLFFIYIYQQTDDR